MTTLGSGESGSLAEPLRAFREVVEAARSTPFAPIASGTSPAGYYTELLADDPAVREHAAATELRYLLDLFAAGRLDPEGLDVLEVGSGFGLGLAAVACLGAGSVLGVELVETSVEWTEQVLDRLPELRQRVRAVPGNAGALPVESESVDVVLSLEAISHYLDYRPFLGEARRVLRPGGTLLISDGNNGLNPRIRRATRELWELHESPPWARPDHLAPDYPFYFVDKRRELLVEAFPQLTEDETLELALQTSGMVRPEVLDAGRRYCEEGVKPDRPHRRGELSVHPLENMVMERLFNPYRLARELRGLGFETRVRGHWGGASGRPLVRAANRALVALTPLTLPTARAFRIAAVKRDGRAPARAPGRRSRAPRA